jgi:hypothetical protein
VDYIGQAGFGNTVFILSGRFRISFLDGHSLSGSVISGTVRGRAKVIIFVVVLTLR